MKQSARAFLIITFLSALSIPLIPPIDARTQYEQLLRAHPYSLREESVRRPGEIRYDRPDLAMMQEFLRTMDPNLFRPTPEVLSITNTQTAILRDYGTSTGGETQSLSVSIGQSQWTERGPNNIGGRTRAILFDPGDPNKKKVWAGSVSGGLWFNTDITISTTPWQKVNDFWDNLAVSCLAADPTNPLVMYAGTGEGWFNLDLVVGAGIWKTIDGGTNWTRLSSTIAFSFVNDIVVRNEGGNGVVYVAVQGGFSFKGLPVSNNGLQRSVDGGNSWNQVLPTSINSQYPTDIEITGDGSKIFVGARTDNTGSASIYSSTNGTSWTTQNFPFDGRVEIATAPSNPLIAYVVFEDNGKVGAIRKTIDGGANWSSDLPLPADADLGIPSNDFSRDQAWYDLIIKVHPENESVVFVGGVDLFRSSDGAASWVQISKWSNNPNLNTLSVPLVHADQHQIISRPGFPNEAVFGNDGGIYYSPNITLSGASLSITSRNLNYNVTQFYTGAIHPTLDNYVLGGTQDNGSLKFTQAGLGSATEAFGGDGAMCFIDDLDPSFQIVSYVFNNYSLSTNGGASFNVSLLNDDNTGNFINTADYDPRMKVLYSGKTSSALYRVKNVTTTKNVSDLTISLGNRASAIRVSPHTLNQTNLFVGTQAGRVFKILNANNTPSISEITGASFPIGSISSISFGANEDQILVTFSNYGISSVWETRDGGVNWSDKEGNLPNMPIRWAEYHHLFPDQVYLATELGVWSTDDINVVSPVWNSTNGGLANVRTDMLRIKVIGNDATIMAATHGRGIFTALVPSALSQDITFDPLPDKILGDPAFLLAATSNSGLSVDYSSSNSSVVSIVGNVGTLISAGTATITATQAGNIQYLPATPVQQTITVLERIISLTGNLSFGEVIVGEEKILSFSVGNIGTAPNNVSISSINYPPGFMGTIQTGATTTIVRVTFKPTTASIVAQDITVLSNATSGDNTIPVTGEGILITSLETPNNNHVKLYPSPTSDQLTIEAPQLGLVESLAVTSVGGKALTIKPSRISENAVKINVSSLSAGVHIIAVPVYNEIVYKKFIKK